MIPAPSYFVSCCVCEKVFVSVASRRQHMRKFHEEFVATHETKKVPKTPAVEKNKIQLKCSECLNFFRSRSSFIDHLTQSHQDINIKTEVFQFSDINSFELWKTDIEKATSIKYRVLKNETNPSGKAIKFYGCHRSGTYITRGGGLRQRESSKINSYCPARIKATVHDNSQVTAEYISTHVGHNVGDSDNLQSPKGKRRARKRKNTEENSTVVKAGKESSNLEKSKEDLKSVVLGFLPLIEKIKKEETSKKLVASLTSLRDTCEEIEIQDKEHSPIVPDSQMKNNSSSNTNFIEKKKRAKLVVSLTSLSDTCEEIENQDKQPSPIVPNSQTKNNSSSDTNFIEKKKRATLVVSLTSLRDTCEEIENQDKQPSPIVPNSQTNKNLSSNTYFIEKKMRAAIRLRNSKSDNNII